MIYPDGWDRAAGHWFLLSPKYVARIATFARHICVAQEVCEKSNLRNTLTLGVAYKLMRVANKTIVERPIARRGCLETLRDFISTFKSALSPKQSDAKVIALRAFKSGSLAAITTISGIPLSMPSKSVEFLVFS